MHKIFTLLFLFLYTASYSQTFELVKDINPDGNSLPRNFFAYKGKLYFLANDGTHGNEPWVSDGTEDGTFLLKDINPGSGSSNPDSYIIYNDLLYFGANNQLWVTDGTEAGTQMVFDVEMEDNIIFDSLIYFGGSNETLWSTDGTAANTIQVGTDEGPQNNFVVYDDKLFYSQGRYTYVVENGVASYYSSYGIRDIVMYKDTLFAFYLDEMRYFEKGSNIPQLVKKLNSYGEAINEVVATKDLIFFSGPADNLGSELWVSDGSAEGTKIIKDIVPGTGSSRPVYLTVVGDKIYFRAKTESNGEELFVSDGTEANTQLIDIIPGAESSLPTNLTAIGNELYFSADDGISGRELWRITADGTLELFQDIEPGSDGGGPEFMTKVGASLFFRASGNAGSELYKVDFNDPCFGVVCPPGEVCYEGSCYPEVIDPCSLVECAEGEICYEGECYPDATNPCNYVQCAEGEACYEGACYPNCTSGATVDCVDLGPDLFSRDGTTIVLSADSGYDVYQWSNGDTTQNILVDASGQYWVIAYNFTDSTSSSDTINVLIECGPEGNCPQGTTCVDGYCFSAADPCADNTCPEGEECFDGACFASCPGSSCNYCYAGNCFEQASCENIICPPDVECVDGSCQSSTSSIKNDLLSGIRFYPNPTDGVININYTGDSFDANIEIRNLLGQKLASKRIEINSGATALYDLSEYRGVNAVFVAIRYEDINIHRIIMITR